MDTISNDFLQLSVGDLHASLHYNTPAISRISLEHDVFTDDDHKPLDTKIMRSFSLYQKHNEEPHFLLLLSTIMGDDNRLVTLTTDKAEPLLMREPSISKVLKNSWQAGSFKEVRQLGVFLFFVFRANS